ncbi:hypothetical protein PoB_002228400 [Plakobranchus ocellatus]|uniref:Esa1-associated factor 6 homolog n=1 Tax=Plakobranchus ocellatus TaxID=259542 RepID=A0AAV3ZN12_9GAST|nr:hypothetical protein PoB_002228400 [Plakobranchus ocellatus]
MATAPSPSRRDVKHEHKRLRVLASDLQKKFEDARSDLNRFSDGYVKSEGRFKFPGLKDKKEKNKNPLISFCSVCKCMSFARRDVDDTVVSDSALRSAGTLLSRVRALPSASRPDRGS